MNKNLLLLAFLLVLTQAGIAQNDSANFGDTVLYITPLEEAFMIDKETKSLFKINPLVNGLDELTRNAWFSFAYEQKLSEAFSLTPSMSIYLNSNISTLGFNLGGG